ncbi:MAG: sulfurtransferase FdhD [Rhodobacteraceae bacterium]|nr:sulfurtransferase FdhD [Paracoccaceae bacterium]RZO37856.1 MAG: sulfurtransferase FdhD [Paracoccaceae bacterium]
MIDDTKIRDYIISPNLSGEDLTQEVAGVDQLGNRTDISVIEERPLTIFLNNQEIVTAMTIGDYPEYLALGFLRNQKMLSNKDKVDAIDFDAELNSIVIRTKRKTNYEDKLKKKTQTSGCAVGTVFGDIMDGVDGLKISAISTKVSHLYSLSSKINRTPSLYLKAGAIHGTILCHQDKPLVYMEDVGRHNAVDKIAGWIFDTGTNPRDKILYTTGRLTSEMVIKTALMEIPVLVSRSGFTAWGVNIAKQVGMTLIGRLRGQRFICLSGESKLIWDVDLNQIKNAAK